jgi:NAD(P)H dehydrogenase (quinone)
MAKVLIFYYSRGGATAEMAKYVAEGANGVAGAQVTVKSVDKVEPKDLLDYDALICGSPTYYGLMAGEIKIFFDRTVTLHGQLEGKVGGAFTSSANLAGGNETTILSILEVMIIHGMIVQGTSQRDHYGPVALGKPDQRATEECRKLGHNVAELAKRLFG